MGIGAVATACILILTSNICLATARTVMGVGDSFEPSSGWTGVILARYAIDVVAEVEAQVESLNVGIGDRVGKGQVLLTLDDTFAVHELEVARAHLQSAQAKLRLAMTEDSYARERGSRRDAIPEAWSKDEIAETEIQMERAAINLEIAGAEVLTQEAFVRQLQVRLEKTRLRAPFPAFVVDTFQDPGSFVREGAAILKLISAGDLRVRFAVPEATAGHLRVEHEVVVIVPAVEASLGGRITRISPEIDSATQMITVEASIALSGPAGERVRSGMMAKVTMASRPSETPGK